MPLRLSARANLMRTLPESTKQEHADLCGAKRTMERCKAKKEKTIEAMKLRDDEISSLRGHVAQLTQSINQFYYHST
jgi:hypothetical protein